MQDINVNITTNNNRIKFEFKDGTIIEKSLNMTSDEKVIAFTAGKRFAEGLLDWVYSEAS